ncbi:helix-turn-helix domain-containing protein [Flavobacterium sp.]|uniref:helix-turn-helix domain-containing protein n=1 Tax=Flavobacterium sp. TaxID=239 RepID=UPI0025BADE56|nr:helix-turn-helix domain-containing protein [Flavobacterium sp.]
MGKFYPMQGLKDFFDVLISQSVKEAISLQTHPADDGRENYTVSDIARLVNRSPETITRHIRLKLIKANKVGKSWVIPRDSYFKYLTAAQSHS